MINKLIEFALNHRLLTVFLIGLVCLWGIVVYFRMPKDIYPELNAPWSRSSPKIQAWLRKTSNG